MYSLILLATLAQLPMEGLSRDKLDMAGLVNPVVYSATDKFGIKWQSSSQTELNTILVRENDKYFYKMDAGGKWWRNKFKWQLDKDIILINDAIERRRQPAPQPQPQQYIYQSPMLQGGYSAGAACVGSSFGSS